MLTTGNQLKAARSLIDMGQNELADRARLNVNTIRSMEGSGHDPIAGRAANVQSVQRVLEAAGVEFLNHGQPGVRLRPSAGELLALQARNARLRQKVDELAKAASADVQKTIESIAAEGPTDGTGREGLDAVHENLRRRAEALIGADKAHAQHFKGLL